MAGSAAQRDLQMSMTPTPFDDSFHPPAASVDLPGLIRQPDVGSFAGWPSLLFDGAQNPAFEPKVVILSRGFEWPGVVFNATSDVVATGYLGARRNGIKRWEIELGDPSPETGNNAGTNFIIDRYTDDGQVVHPSPMIINRATGQVTFALVPTFSVLPPQATTSAEARDAGIEIGQPYLNGDALMIRTS